MSLTVVVIEGIDETMFSWADPEVRERNIVRALNRTASRTRTKMDRAIREEVNFPASYLRPSAGRLTVKDKASKGKLETSIEGRERATSLARFLPPGQRVVGGKRGSNLRNKKAQAIRVTVKPGSPKPIRGAFVVKLRGGEGGNLGLAIRTKGGPPDHAYKPKPLKSFGENVWLLYGPSVNQVLWSVRNKGGVFTQVADETLKELEDEFVRLMEVEARKV